MPTEDERFRAVFDAHFDDLWRFARRRCPAAADSDDVTADVFAIACLVVAALDGADVVERGGDTVAGVSATRYDIDLTDRSIAALSSLTDQQLAWFDLDEPGNVDELSVWIAGGHIRRIETVHSNGAATRSTFSDLNGSITITPPPGPYAEPEGD